jgi:hypothetical protein
MSIGWALCEQWSGPSAGLALQEKQRQHAKRDQSAQRELFSGQPKSHDAPLAGNSVAV